MGRDNEEDQTESEHWKEDIRKWCKQDLYSWTNDCTITRIVETNWLNLHWTPKDSQPRDHGNNHHDWLTVVKALGSDDEAISNINMFNCSLCVCNFASCKPLNVFVKGVGIKQRLIDWLIDWLMMYIGAIHLWRPHSEEGGQAQVDGGEGGQAPCGRPHRKLKLESTDVILSSSHAKKFASFFTRISSLGRKKVEIFLRYELVIQITKSIV